MVTLRCIQHMLFKQTSAILMFTSHHFRLLTVSRNTFTTFGCPQSPEILRWLSRCGDVRKFESQNSRNLAKNGTDRDRLRHKNFRQCTQMRCYRHWRIFVTSVCRMCVLVDSCSGVLTWRRQQSHDGRWADEHWSPVSTDDEEAKRSIDDQLVHHRTTTRPAHG